MAGASRTSLVAALLAGGGIGFAAARALPRTQRCAAELESLIEARTRELSDLATHLQDLAEAEKTALARNLHDELGGLLTAAKMDLSWLLTRMSGDAALQQRLQQLGSALDEAMDVKRRVVEDLRPSLLDHFGLATALGAHLDALCAKSHLECEFEDLGDCETPKDIAIVLFRVAQEGLSNVLRHAGARHVRLALASTPRSYRLELNDDGRGFDPAGPEFRWSHGITAMRHRVRALGGSLELDSSPGRGTTLRVELPRRAAPGDAQPAADPDRPRGAQRESGVDHLERPSATRGFKRPMSRILSRK
ncbi:MAG: sensor histidine kinase [Steroidobacteraceae bacterium]